MGKWDLTGYGPVIALEPTKLSQMELDESDIFDLVSLFTVLHMCTV
jgi:hypothetical protein